MFNSSYKWSNQFPSVDLDEQDTRSCFSSQTSAWYGIAAGSGFLSAVCSNSGRFGNDEPDLRRWQSSSYSELEHAPLPFHPPGDNLRAAWGESSLRQAEVMKWLKDAHEKADSHLDQLKSRNRQLSYNKSSGRLLDMKHKLLSEARIALERQKEAVYLYQHEKSQGHGELHEKVHKLEKDLFEMKAGKNSASNSLPTEKMYGSHKKASPVSREDIVKQGKLKVETDTHRLREDLREAEERARTQEEELDKTLQELKASQEEKALLSTQVLKLEDNVNDLKSELSKALADKDLLIENEKLREELEMIKQSLEMSQKQLQEFKEEKVMHAKQITDLETQCSRLTREKEELLVETNIGGCKFPSEMKEKCSQQRNSVKLLESQNQTLWDQCLCLQNEILEKEKMMHLQEEDYQKQDVERVRTIEELKAMMSHWTEKWQKVALTLQSKQEELDKHKKSNSGNEKDCDSLLRVELDAYKQELQLERNKSQTLLLRYKARGDGEIQTQDKQTETDLSESSLLWEPPSDCHRNKSPQASRDGQDDVNQQADVLGADTVRAELDVSHRSLNQLQQEKMSAVQRRQALKERLLDAEDKSDKTICQAHHDTDQQRRMVTEQAAVDRRNWLPDSCLMPVFEEDEENDDWPEEKERETAASSNLPHQRQQMSPPTAVICELKEKSLNLQQAVRPKQMFQSSSCLDNSELQRMKTPALSPDGIFKAELVDICSPDEEGEQMDKICS